MKWREDTAADIVVGTAAKVAEDMVHGTAAAIREIVQYRTMYENMATMLDVSGSNLEKLSRKKWIGREDRNKLRKRIGQVRALVKICLKMQTFCSGFANGTITELKKMEASKRLNDIVENIESDEEEEA